MRATGKASKEPTRGLPKLAHVRQPRTAVVNPAKGSPLDRNEEQDSGLRRSVVDRDKEEDGFVHLWWEETREGGTVGGAHLTIETGSLSTIGIKAKVGIDIGVQGPKSGLTKQGEELLSAEYGRRILSDYHGLAVYQREPPPQFLSLNATGIVGRNIKIFEKCFSDLITQPPQLGDRDRIALHLFHASFFRPPDTRFLLLIMTIEALISPAQAKSAAAVKYVEDFIATINASELEKCEKNSLVGSLRHLKNRSISQSGKRLAKHNWARRRIRVRLRRNSLNKLTTSEVRSFMVLLQRQHSTHYQTSLAI
jgi:hypothetical protein